MKIRYDIKASIANKNTGTSSAFPAKTLEAEVTAANDNLLYNNNHIIAKDVYLFDLFKDEVQTYSNALGVPVNELEFDSFEVTALAPPDKYRMYFEFDGDRQKQDLRPTIKVYIGPKNDLLERPVLKGDALDQNSILWSWDEAECAHYLVTEPIDPENPDDNDKIIAQLPIGVNEYVETPLDPGTSYTRRLIAYTSDQYSEVSSPCTVWTETISPDIVLQKYEEPRLYDFTIDESQRDIIEERMKAFHSGVGDFTDLQVYKQMDADFYQKFKAYFEITGRRLQRERRYEQVGFWYKVCLDAYQRIQEQEGEVTFDVYAYPREWLRLQDYVWATEDVEVQATFEATVFLQQEEDGEADCPVTVYNCNVTHHTEHVPDEVIEHTKPHSGEIEVQFAKPSCIMINVDLSGSMGETDGYGATRMAYVQQEVDKFLRYVDTRVKEDVDKVNQSIDAAINSLPANDPARETLKSKKINESQKSNMMLYIIMGWNAYRHTLYYGYNVGEAIGKVYSMYPKYGGNTYTSFYEGFMNAAANYQAHCQGRDIVGHFFFTDGLCNTANSSSWEWPNAYRYSPGDAAGGEHAWNILKSIANGVNATKPYMQTYMVFGTLSGTESCIDEWYARSTYPQPYSRKQAAQFGNIIKEKCQYYLGQQYVYYPSSSGWSLNYRNGSLCDVLKEGVLKLFPKEKIEYEWTEHWTETIPQPDLEYDTFDGWNDLPAQVDSISRYNLDSMVAVTVQGGPYYYTFTDSEDCTPVVYSRAEKRAVIGRTLPDDASRNYYVDDNGRKVKILDEILRLVQETPEWQSGYQTLVRTSSGKVMVKGLFIKDNYTVGDQGFVYSHGWCNGMEGTINSFTEIDHGESDSYGDDCYLVDESSVLQVQGFTNAMIFDGEHAVSAELNAYDYPQVNAIHSNGSVIVSNGVDVPCSTFMFNRVTKLNYDGSGPYNHCVDIVECDRDIILEGLDNLIQEEVDPDELEEEGGAGQNIIQRRLQQYQVFEPMTRDIVGKIELWYRSPVLNYRFNLEDPDAKTSIYEILPDCNPDDNFLHVVLLHVYYARNVYITDGPNPEMLNGNPQPGFNYVASYGDDPIAYYGDPNLLDDDPNNAEGLYKWTQKMWQNPSFYDNGWYLDDFVWFQAEKMMKDIPYHDELPDESMQPFYGLVNGRYTSKRQDGKQDLLVQVPQFNIPETVRDYYIHYGGSRNPINWNGDGTHPLKIYIVLTEFHPKDALVGYKWDKDCRWVNPETGKVNDDITQDYKGCYATFSCDSVTYKDIEYFDLVQTINFENQEVFDTKNNMIHYQLEKPDTEYTYTNYYLKVSTDNSDVLPLNYPGEIMFDESGHSDFGVTYKGVVNATTKWSPRIHNGYYYLNQHEYFAYSEFAFDREKTNVEHNEIEKCITVFGHMVFDVTLCHKAAPPEIYRGDNAIVKNTRSTLLQNENEFIWVDGKGVTLKPTIDGIYYKEYKTYMYYSPVLSFPNTLTMHGPISIDFAIDDGTDEIMNVEIRSYVLEEGHWSDWYPLAGVEIPCVANTNYTLPTEVPLSHAYQVRFPLQASVTNTTIRLEDYLCCYLDWKDDGEESACYNIVTITDHMTTGPYRGKGVYVSKIFDFGTKSTMELDMFQSNYNDKIKLYVASSIDKNDLYVENATWEDAGVKVSVNNRYIRYKIEIPEGEKLYWLHKKITTTETEAILPYVKGFTMEGEYHPQDVITNFINTEAFEIPADGDYHDLEDFSDLTRIIGDDVLDRNYTMDEIKKVDIRCTTDNITVLYNSNLLNEYPGNALKDTQLRAKTLYQTFTDITYTPYIFLDEDMDYDKITIYGATPQQYCPITVEDPEGQTYIQLHECTDFEQTLKIVCNDKTKYIELPTNRYDYLTMTVKVNGQILDESHYKITNHLIIFNDFLEIGDEIVVTYYIMYSFISKIERYGDNNEPPNTIVYLYTGYRLNNSGEKEYIQPAEKYKVFFETSLRNNKFTANNLSLNPIYRTDYKGFIYLTDDNNEPYTIKIYCNPRRIKAGGYDKVDVAIEVLDILRNPVINREVYIDCGAVDDDDTTFDRGIINCDNYMTDMNGVVHFVYESSVLPVEAKIRASVFNCAGASIEDTITIVNE